MRYRVNAWQVHDKKKKKTTAQPYINRISNAMWIKENDKIRGSKKKKCRLLDRWCMHASWMKQVKKDNDRQATDVTKIIETHLSSICSFDMSHKMSHEMSFGTLFRTPVFYLNLTSVTKVLHNFISLCGKHTAWDLRIKYWMTIVVCRQSETLFKNANACAKWHWKFWPKILWTAKSWNDNLNATWPILLSNRLTLCESAKPFKFK